MPGLWEEVRRGEVCGIDGGGVYRLHGSRKAFWEVGVEDHCAYDFYLLF